MNRKLNMKYLFSLIKTKMAQPKECIKVEHQINIMFISCQKIADVYSMSNCMPRFFLHRRDTNS